MWESHRDKENGMGECRWPSSPRGKVGDGTAPVSSGSGGWGGGDDIGPSSVYKVRWFSVTYIWKRVAVSSHGGCCGKK
jgi:hypothetical protein